MELTEEYHLLCIKNKLQTNLKYYLLGSNKQFHLVWRVIEILKVKYNNIDTFNELEQLRQNLYNYMCSNESLRVEDWIFNWKNICLITDLNKFVDTSRNYELEEQIREIQKQNNELKEISIEQNNKIELIEEDVKNIKMSLNNKIDSN